MGALLFEGLAMPAGKAKAHCFSVLLEGGTAVEVQDLLKAFAKRKKAVLDVESGGKRLQASEPHWPRVANGEIFTGTLCKVRREHLPALISDEGPKRLEIPDNTGLGEEMCFAYDPLAGKALVYRGQNAPAASAIAAFLRQLGFDHKVRIEPVIWPDMMKRLARTHFIKRFVFSLKGMPDNIALAAR